jgi:hypothetical protein
VDLSTAPPGPDYSGPGRTAGGQPGHQIKSPEATAHDPSAVAAIAGATVEPGAGKRRVLTPETPRMRSSIACVRCRRSKVKCLNEGVNTPCRACKVSGRDCVYPTSTYRETPHLRDENADRAADNGLASPGVRRRFKLGSGADRMQIARSARSKQKKLSAGPHTQSMRALVDALDPTTLTPQVWLDLVFCPWLVGAC